MENIMMLPASYCVMNEEEIDLYHQVVPTPFRQLLLGLIPSYAWLAGVTAIRDYRKSHPKNWTSTGTDALNYSQMIWGRVY